MFEEPLPTAPHASSKNRLPHLRRQDHGPRFPLISMARRPDRRNTVIPSHGTENLLLNDEATKPPMPRERLSSHTITRPSGQHHQARRPVPPSI